MLERARGVLISVSRNSTVVPQPGTPKLHVNPPNPTPSKLQVPNSARPLRKDLDLGEDELTKAS